MCVVCGYHVFLKFDVYCTWCVAHLSCVLCVGSYYKFCVSTMCLYLMFSIFNVLIVSKDISWRPDEI
jgi:hypothetical protein